MNATVKRILGEANYHSPEERAGLDQARGGAPQASGAREERREVALARQILAAAEGGRTDQIHRLAYELIRMHQRPQSLSARSVVGLR